VYSRMTTAGQVCAGHTHAPRLEGKSSCPAGGTSPKGKAKAKDGLPLPDHPSKPGCGVSHLWRGTHLEGMPKDAFSYVSDYTHKRRLLVGLMELERTFGIVYHERIRPLSFHKSPVHMSTSAYSCMGLRQESCPDNTGHTPCMFFSWLG